jgi:hypothetical protein
LNIDVFSTREIATSIWIFLIALYLLFQDNIRNSIINLVKVSLRKQPVFYFLSYLCYLASIIYSLYYFGLWDLTNLKDTVIWFIFSGLPLGLTVVTTRIVSDFWKNLVLDNLKLVVLVIFIISSFTFPLIAEFVLIPIITLIVTLNTIAKRDETYKLVEKITESILVLFGIILIFYSVYRSLNEIYSFGNISTFKSFMLPVVFSGISIPYMYVLKLYAEYESLFLRLKFGKEKSKKLNLLIKLRLLLFCNIQLKKLEIAKNMNNYNIMSISSKAEIDDMITAYENALFYEGKSS